MNHQFMHQVNVTTAKGNQIPVGPKFSEKPAAEQLAYMMRQAIAGGKLHGWHDPTVVTLISVEQ